MQANEAYKNFL